LSHAPSETAHEHIVIELRSIWTESEKFVLHSTLYDLQWNLFIMDTLGPAISGSFLLLYRGFPFPEVKMY